MAKKRSKSPAKKKPKRSAKPAARRAKAAKRAKAPAKKTARVKAKKTKAAARKAPPRGRATLKHTAVFTETGESVGDDAGGPPPLPTPIATFNV